MLRSQGALRSYLDDEDGPTTTAGVQTQTMSCIAGLRCFSIDCVSFQEVILKWYFASSLHLALQKCVVATFDVQPSSYSEQPSDDSTNRTRVPGDIDTIECNVRRRTINIPLFLVITY